jgi:hypothetical protein
MRFPIHGAWVTHRASLVVAVVLGLFSAAANAEERAMNVWYRSVEGCPAGTEFIARVTAKGVPARLASVGDSIDFVVTLGTGTGSTGLLERQTSEGTVAVRTVEGDTCDQVANALALSLVLAAEGTAPRAQPAPPAVAPVPAAPPPTPAVPRPDPPPAPPDQKISHSPATRSIEWSVGIQGTLTTGVSPALLPGAALFVDGSRLTRFGSSLRLSIAGGTTSNDVGGNTFRVSLVQGKLEGCPATIGSVVQLAGCAALDLGVMATSGAGAEGSSDSAFWSAAEVLARLALHPGGRIAVEAQGGALVPFTRYELGVGNGSNSLYRTAAAGFAGAVGVAMQIP